MAPAKSKAPARTSKRKATTGTKKSRTKTKLVKTDADEVETPDVETTEEQDQDIVMTERRKRMVQRASKKAVTAPAVEEDRPEVDLDIRFGRSPPCGGYLCGGYVFEPQCLSISRRSDAVFGGRCRHDLSSS